MDIKKNDEIRNYFTKEINHSELISKKHKKTCKTLDYVEHLLILASTFTGCVSISSFASVVGIPVEITKFCGWTKNLHNNDWN